MVDVHDIATRSYNMSQIIRWDTKPEMLVKEYLQVHCRKHRLHNSTLLGKPDLALIKYSTLLFVNGYFWHGHKEYNYIILLKSRAERL
jgi:DNA mismatch endonuclease, patch repair protein